MRRNHLLSKRASTELSRRRLLRGLVSTGVYTLALPPFDFMMNANGTAYADGSLFEPFFGIFFWGNGMVPSYWVPQGQGSNWTVPESLKPLANRNLKNDVSVVSGMSIHAGGERGHHAGAARILSGAPFQVQAANGSNYASTFSAPSIDQQIARALPQTTQFKSLELGVADDVTTSEGTTLQYLSHNGPNSPNEAIFSESRFFQKVFGSGGSGVPGTPSPTVNSQFEKLVVDTVIQDAADLRKQIGVSDQHRLDQHLEFLYDVQSNLGGNGGSQSTPTFQCTNPAAPQNNGSDWAKKSRDMAKILAMAVACRKSRVFTIHFSGSVGGTRYPGTNQSTNYHDLTHNHANLGDMRTATTFIIDQFSKFLEEMKAIQVGAGNLLDHAAILATSDCSDGQAHSGENYPILIAGRAGGRLRSGLHVAAQGEHTNKVLLTLAQAVGANISGVGVGSGAMSQGLSAIKA
ncbi:MAG: DUF1552 domain-containing protein [Oligoflexales bacterium]|nr:DUF1552 domain-containing protein [Oligoflexales bacterium]